MKIKDENKIELIYKSTLELIEERGISGISIDLIAKKAKIATGTVYIYFKNKDDLINKLYIETKKSFYKSLFDGYLENAPFKISFRKIWYNLLNIMISNYKENIFHEQYQHSQYSNEETIKLSSEMILPIMNIIERGKKEGLIKNIDNLLICAYIYGCIKEMINLSKFFGNKLDEKMVEDFFVVCWDGIKA